MKKSFLLVFLFPALLLSCGQGNMGEKGKQHDIQVYHQAIAYGDIGTAIYSIHSLLARDTTNHSYYDTLAMLYYNSNNLPQAIQAAQKALKTEPGNEKLMQVVADASKRAGHPEVALPYYLKLAEKTKNPEFDYEAAVLQSYGEHFPEAETAINKVLGQPATGKYFVVIISGNISQKVPLNAALYNLLGYIRQKQDKKDEARENYIKALAIYPDFTLAKNNLAVVSKK